MKYGVELLTFAIKEHNLELIDDIYKKCMTYFKEDLMNNKSFLSIITSTMALLDEYYPEYILKYSSETNMIIDSSFYGIEHRNKNLHLYSFFQYPQIANLSQSLLWTKFQYKFTHTFWFTDLSLLVNIRNHKSNCWCCCYIFFKKFKFSVEINIRKYISNVNTINKIVF